MESAYVYDQMTVISELTQGIQMAKELRFNLNSPGARDFLIQKIFSSYENALFILKSGESTGQPMAAALPAPSLPESTTSTGSCLQSGDFVCDQYFVHQQDQNVVSKKRKGSTIVENAFKGKYTCYNGAQSAEPLLPPPLLEKHETNYNFHVSQPNPCEMLSNLKTNHSVSSLCSFPSSQFGFMEEYQQLQSPVTSEDEVLQVFSPLLVSPDTSESNYFSEWDSNSPPSLDFTVDQDDSDYYFKVNNSFFSSFQS